MNRKQNKLMLICGLIVMATQLGLAEPVQWDQNCHSYEVIVVGSGAISWLDAQAAAVAKGGYLVTTTSLDELEFVFDLTIDTPGAWISSGEHVIGPWVGAIDVTGEGDWQWVTGEPMEEIHHPDCPEPSCRTEVNGDYLIFWGCGAPCPAYNDASGYYHSYVIEYEPERPVVPNVLGMSETEAEAALIVADLIKGEVELACDTVGFGVVMAQDPVAGTEVCLESEVDLVMGILVPDVVGLIEADAEISLIDAGLTKRDSTYECSDTVPAGLVIGQSLIDGTIVQCASPVDLVISGALVPNLVGMTETDADIALIAANLIKGSVVEEHSDTVPAGDVISQSPDPGTIVACGSAVDLVISLGPSGGGGGGCIIIEDDFNDGVINLEIWRNADDDPIGENYPYRYPIERNGRLEIVNNNTNDTDGLRTVINLPVDGYFQAQVSFDASECDEESALSFSVHNAATDYDHFVQHALVANAVLTDGGRQWIVAKSAGTGDENLVIEASEPTSQSNGVFYMTYDAGVITFSHTGFGAENAMHTVDISGWTDCTQVWLYLGASSNGAFLTGAGSYFDDFYLSTCEPAHIDIIPDTISTRAKTITSYIWPPDGYDVTQIDPESIRLEGSISPLRTSVRKHQQMLVVKFPTSGLDLVPGPLELTVRGELTDGTTFEDSNSVTVVQKGGKPS